MIRLMFYSLLGWAAWRIVEENRQKPTALPSPERAAEARKRAAMRNP